MLTPSFSSNSLMVYIKLYQVASFSNRFVC